MVFKATCNNNSVLSRWSILLVEETGENHRPATSHRHDLSHIVVLSTTRLSRIRSHNLSVCGDRY
jgi:hypothetical protein